MGAEFPRVSVFESDNMAQVLVLKKKLEDAGIPVSYTHLDVYKRQL